MDLRQLEYFVAVAEEAGFTKAAERVHVTQSGVSSQIRLFEREVGAALFDRSSRMVRLTAAGQAALPYARSALAAAEEIRRAIDDVTGLVRGRLRVGMIAGCTVAPLFTALASFHVAHPRIEIVLIEAGSELLAEQVHAGLTDCALVSAAAPRPEQLTAHAVASERLTALVPADHALAGEGIVALRRLVAYPLICLPVGTGVRDALDGACAAAGLRPNVTLQVTAPEAVACLAARGLGVAVLGEPVATAQPDLTAVPIEGATTLALIWRREPPVLRAFLPHCRDAFRKD